jgi:hypothetical protein
MPAVVAVLAAVLLGATGLAAAAALRVARTAELLLAAFVFAFAEIVLLALVLSPFGALRRPVLAAGLALLFLAAVAFWWRRGRPLPPGPRLGFVLRSPPLAALALVVGLALAYVVALVVATAPNTWDSLVYHLTRAALWRQDGAIGYVEEPFDDRLNANPPNAEIALTFVLELTRDERFAGFVQLFAALACVVGAYELSRRVGLAAREAAFGALLLLTLPIVVLQASTTQNDVVVAALLVAATVFVVGQSRADLRLAALATALAMGTKVTAVFALPLLCAAALAAPPRAARLGRLAAIGIGAAAGSYWYLVNLGESGRLLGDRPDTDLLALGELRENLLAGFARILDAFDLSGAESTDRFVLPGLTDSDVLAYAVAAVVLAAGLVAASLATRRRLALRLGLAAGAMALVPLLVAPVGYGLWRVFAKAHDVVGGRNEALPAGEWPPQTTAGESLSWFGPLGLVLVAGATIASVVLFRRRAVPPLALVLAGAPLAWLVLFSLTIEYDIWQGRFFVYPVALSAALWGLVLRAAPLAWAAVAIGATTVVLSFVNSLEKPAGVQLFADRSTESVWELERWEVQALLRPELTSVLRYLDERVPEDASIALVLGEDDYAYPAFGPQLEREIELVSRGEQPDAEWLVARPERADEIDATCWRTRLESEGGTVFERSEACASGPPG